MVYGNAMDIGKTTNVTNRSAAAMLTKRKLVSVLISGLFVTMKIRRRFPVRATKIVREYNIVFSSGVGPESEVSVEVI